jgi:hypothetical protein
VSDFRKQLDSARSQYRARRYPGDLAAELLSARRTRVIPWTILATTISGIAAALFFWIGRPLDPSLNKPTSIPPDAVAIVPATQEYAESILMPAMPDFLELTPAAEELSIPAIPSLPSVDYAGDFPSTDITQESA